MKCKQPLQILGRRPGLLTLVLLSFILLSCGGEYDTTTKNRSGTCELGFSVIWGRDLPAGFQDQNASDQLQRGLIQCAEISSVSAVVYSEDNTVLSSGGPWDCSAGSGTLEDVPAGGYATVVIMGQNAGGRVLYWGQSDEVFLETDTIVDAGTIEANSFVPVVVAPAHQAQVGQDQFVLQWQAVNGAEAYQAIIAETQAFTDPVVDENLDGGDTTTYAPLGLESERTYYWRVSALDFGGSQSAWSLARSFTVTLADNTPPVAEIISPSDGASYPVGGNVVFSGIGSDEEDGDLADSALEWVSDVDGIIGYGATVQTTSLSLGQHLITLTATDSQGASHTTASITINIYQPSGLDLSGDWSFTTSQPTVVGSCPAGNATSGTCRIVQTGNQFTFEFLTGVVCDPEFTCSYTGNVSGSQFEGANGGTDGSGGSITNTLIFSASSSDNASGQGTSLYILDTFQCTWNHDIQLTRLPPGTNQAPLATIFAPADGLIFDQDQLITFSGIGEDPEDGPLPSTGLTWNSSIDGVIGAGNTLSYQDLTIGTHVITLTAMDSLGATASDSINISINAPPSVVISNPINGVRYDSGASATFSGSATDREDGHLSSSGLSWNSDLDDYLGNGSPLLKTDLSYGRHTITLSAADSHGLESTSTIILLMNSLPFLELYQPTDGSHFRPGTEFGLEVGTSTYDPEDGSLPNSAMVWTSSLDGPLGTGNYLLVNDVSEELSYGVHTITCTVTDSLGSSTSESRTITINTPPLAAIAAPVDFTYFTPGAAVNCSGDGDDFEDGVLTGTSLVWTYRQDDGNGLPMGPTFSVGTSNNPTFLMPNFSIILRLTVTDTLGDTEFATVRLYGGG